MPCDNCSCGSASGTSTSTKTAVPLPRPGGNSSSSESNGKVWSLHPEPSRSASPHRHHERDEALQEILGDVQPLAKKCGADEREGHQCCKDLKGDDERHLISPEIVRDV